jgi:uncharacterized protein (DUF2267 family)
MSATGPRPFDATLQLTHTWLNELSEEMNWADRARAYHALRAVLHTLRDRLSVDEVAALGAQLPMLVRGFYYEGWRPDDHRHKGRNREGFLAEVGAAFPDDPEVQPERVSHAVFRLLRRHISAGEIEGIKHVLPVELQALWG